MAHYIDNEKFCDEIQKYNVKYREAKDKGLPRPKMNDYLGKCFMMIANKLANSYKFRNYIFREEMEADAIGDCINYIYNFDSSKNRNAFAYFTQAAYNAFLRRIAKEKKELYTKYKYTDKFEMEHGLAEGEIVVDIGTGSSDAANDYRNEFIRDFEQKEKEKKEKAKKK